MKKIILYTFILLFSAFLISGCATVEEDAEKVEEDVTKTGVYNSVNLADEYDSLLTTVKNNLKEGTYHSDEYNLDIPYGVYVPEDYDSNDKYPLVMFIPDSTLAGKDVEAILEQGYGGVVWADKEVQTGNPALILYPAYPEVTVDDHNGYQITDYVPATVGLIDTIKNDYSIDENRIYSTGQSMGCMTSMILASQNPDLFAASMFVDGQWDPTTLEPLADQTFCYFAAEGDTSAYNGMQSEIPVWKENGASIVEETWNGEWSQEEIQEAAQKMIKENSKIYCIVWEEGTITPKEMGFGGMKKEDNSGDESEKTDFKGPDGASNTNDAGSSGAPDSSIGIHMASFDYAYKVNTMVGWTLLQEK